VNRRRLLAALGVLAGAVMPGGRMLFSRLLHDEPGGKRTVEGLLAGLHADGPVGESVAGLVVRSARLLAGSPYGGGTLEGAGPERLRYTLEAFDCVTLVETALALARCAARNDTGTTAFERELTRIRYRRGVMEGYPSRLHYFLDWIGDNTRKGIVRDVTHELGGGARTKRISFMTGHADRYPPMSEDGVHAAMLDVERRLSGGEFHEIPLRRVAGAAEGILPGDIIGITTTRKGLDVSHTGVAVRDAEILRLLHAGTTGSRVEEAPGSLAAFVAAHPGASGIVVARPLSIG
jgi:hypothetical protein